MPSLVSVVIPCYRQAHFVADAVGSVFKQTYPAREVIVLDDGSPDRELMDQVLAPYTERIIFIRQENRGLSAARNAGLARCSGTFVVFLDADDRLLPNALGEGVAALASHPECALAWGFRNVIDADGNLLQRDAGRKKAGDAYVDLLRTNVVGPPVSVIWRRAMLEAIGGFSESLPCAEDYDAYLRVARQHPLHCHRVTVAEYRLHGANMSNDAAQMLAAVDQVHARQREFVGPDPRLQRALRSGRRDARYHYVWMPRLERLHRHVVAGRWALACAASVAMLARYPVRFSPILARHAPRVLWRLLIRQVGTVAGAPQ